jgi:outer membrane protein
MKSASFPIEAPIQAQFRSDLMFMRTTLVFLLAVPLWAQGPLSLREAVRLAIRENKGVAGANAGARASEARIAQARGGMLPKINYSESFARSDNPVFVFSSLLTQHQFGVENFAIGPLNRPDFLNNFQSQLTVDQPIYDAGQTRNAVKSAELAQKMTGEEQRLVQMNVISGAARAYYGAVLAAESLQAAEQAVRSAAADLKRAEAVRAAGMSTDVDVLSIRVHLAAVTEQRIDRAADVDIAKAALNDALGLPLDTPHTLTTPLEALVLPDMALEGLEGSASTGRPEARQTHLATSLAQTQADGARSAMLPQVGFRGAFEADRQRFVDRGGANWLASVSLRWNLFNGSADKARIAETGHLVKRAEFDERLTDRPYGCKCGAPTPA